MTIDMNNQIGSVENSLRADNFLTNEVNLLKFGQSYLNEVMVGVVEF